MYKTTSLQLVIASDCSKKVIVDINVACLLLRCKENGSYISALLDLRLNSFLPALATYTRP